MTTLMQPNPPPPVGVEVSEMQLVKHVPPPLSIPLINGMKMPVPLPGQMQVQMPMPMPMPVPVQGPMAPMPGHMANVLPAPGVMPVPMPVPMPVLAPNMQGGPMAVPLHMQMGQQQIYFQPPQGTKMGGTKQHQQFQQPNWGYPQNHQQQGPSRGQFPGKGRRRDTGELSKNNIYINCLKSTTKDEDLKTLCLTYGPIISAKAIIDRETNQCKGYGFVMFEKESSAKLAVNALVRKGAQAAFAKVTRAQEEWQGEFSGRQEADPTNLYLTNLPNDQDEGALSSMLVQCLENVKGEVVSCRILREPDGLSRRVGLARMDCREACEVIIKRLNGCILPGCVDPLRVKFANSPSPRKSKFLNRREMGRSGRPSSFSVDTYDLPDGVLGFMQGQGPQSMPDLSSLQIDPAAATQNPYIPQAMMLGQPFEAKGRPWVGDIDRRGHDKRGHHRHSPHMEVGIPQQQIFERHGPTQEVGYDVNFGDVHSIFSDAAVAQANAQRRAQDKFAESYVPPQSSASSDQYRQYEMGTNVDSTLRFF